MTAIRKQQYPGKVAIRHAVEIARDLGLDVAGFEVTPEGVIRIIDRKSVAPAQAAPTDEWEEWDRAGKLG